MCSDLFIDKTKCALEDGLKDSCVLNILWNLQKDIQMELLLRKLATVFRAATFLNEVFYQIYFLWNSWIV